MQIHWLNIQCLPLILQCSLVLKIPPMLFSRQVKRNKMTFKNYNVQPESVEKKSPCAAHSKRVVHDGPVTTAAFKSTSGNDIQDKVRWKLQFQKKHLALLNPYCKPTPAYCMGYLHRHHMEQVMHGFYTKPKI